MKKINIEKHDVVIRIIDDEYGAHASKYQSKYYDFKIQQYASWKEHRYYTVHTKHDILLYFWNIVAWNVVTREI